MTATVLTLRPVHAIREDRVNGVIHLVVEGFFDLDTLDEHFTEKAEVVDRWRAEGRPIKVFIDAVNLLPHSPEGQARVQSAMETIYRAGDRVAIQVSSSLVKMQMRRALQAGDTINFFLSKDAALMWLGVAHRRSGKAA